MKNLFLILFVTVYSHSYGQKQTATNDSTRLKKYITANLTTFTFDGNKPIGKGWEVLEKQFAGSQFVGWGEYHNSNTISQLASYALKVASKYGFKNWCVEVSPFVASELMRIGKSENPLDSLSAISKDHPNYGTFPFFKTTEDVQMLVTANQYHYKVWGIDQEFQMAFPYCISRAYDAQKPKVKKQYLAVRDSLLAKWWMPKVKLLDSLKKVVAQDQLKAALEDVKISRGIYYNEDNLGRATLMKNNFYNYYDNATQKQPKVFFKMGANHLAKGMNLNTHIYDIGNAIYELSQRNHTTFCNVYFINRYYTEKGKVIDDLNSEYREYPAEFLKLYDQNNWVVVDVRNFRGRYNNDKTLTDDTYGTIEKYDFVVISPEVKK